jgi:predicted metal-dependent hydrolase
VRNSPHGQKRNPYNLFSKKVPLDWNLINKKMALYGKKADREELAKAVEEFSQDEIKNDLTRFLPVSHRNLVKEIKELTLKKLKTSEVER